MECNMEIDTSKLEDLIRQHESRRNETQSYPNSFGHGYFVGKLEVLREFLEMASELDGV